MSKRSVRLPLLFAWAVILGVVIYVGTHTQVVAPFASRLLTRHLLSDLDGKVRIGDFRIRPLQGVDLYNLSATFQGDDGAMTLVAVDTLELDFQLLEVLRPSKRLRGLHLHDGEIYTILGDPDSTRGKPPPLRDLALPTLQVDRLWIDDVTLEVSGADGRLQERISTLHWRGQVASRDSLKLRFANCGFVWDTRDSRLAELTGEMVVHDAGISATTLSGRLNDGAVRASGIRRWDESVDLKVYGENASTGEVENLIDQTIDLPMRGRFDGTVVAANDTVVLAAVYSGTLENYDLQEIEATAVITPDRVTIDPLRGRVNTVWFDGTGSVEIGDPDNVNFTLIGEVADVDLTRDLIPGEADLPVTDGHGRLTLFHDIGDTLTRVNAVLYDGRIEHVPFDSCFVNVVADPARVVFNSIDLAYGSWRGRLVGVADSTAEFSGRADVSADDLADAPAAWGWPALSGSVRSQGTLQGQLDALLYVGWVDGRDLRLDPVVADYAVATVAIDDILGEAQFRVHANGSGLSVSRVPFGRFDVDGEIATSGTRIDSFHAVRGDTVVTLSCSIAAQDSAQTITLDRLDVGLAGAQWSLDREVEIRTAPGEVAVPRLRFRSDQGSLFVRDFNLSPAELGGSLQLENFDLGLLRPLLALEYDLTGQATAEVRLDGRRQAPTLSLAATVTGSRFDLATVDSCRVVASYANDTVSIDSLWLATNHGQAAVHGTVAHAGVAVADFWPGAELDLEIDFHQADWGFLDPFEILALDRLAGQFEGRTHLGGTTREPLLTGRVTSAPFHIHWLHLDTLVARIRADSRQLVLADLRGRKQTLELTGRLEIPLEFDLLSEPVASEDGPFYMALSLPPGSDLAPLNAATNAFITTSGTGEAEVIVSGPLLRPRYQGRVKIENAGFMLRGMEEIYRNCYATGSFVGDELILDELRGEEGQKGTFQGSGKLVFDGLALKTFDLALSADRFLIASVPDLRVLVRSNDARISGAHVGPDSLLVPRFSGTLDVIRGRYTGDFSETGGGADPRAGTVAPDWLANVHLRAEPRTLRITNHAMELDMSGDVNLVRDMHGLYLRGTMNIDKGRLPVFNNNFEVVSGRLDFSQEVGLTPRIDLTAETRVRLRSRVSSSSVVERVTVQVNGSIFEPSIAFNSESGYSRAGVERMLMGLSPYESEDDAVRLRNTSIAAGLNLVEREIAREFNLVDTFEIDQINRQNPDGGQGFDPLVGFGKYVSLFGADQNLYVKYAQGFDFNDRDILIEIQIGNYLVLPGDHLLLQSEIRRRLDEYQGEDTYNLDLKYRVEY